MPKCICRSSSYIIYELEGSEYGYETTLGIRNGNHENNIWINFGYVKNNAYICKTNGRSPESSGVRIEP